MPTTEELLCSNEDVQSFACVAAHDLRAPLHASVTLLQMLEGRAKLEDEDRQVLLMATAGLRRVQTLMADILAYTQAGGVPIRTSVPLQEPLEIALANLRQDVEGARARIQYGILPTVYVDRLQLMLVFQNLVSNAIKFRSEEPPRVRIGAVARDRAWVVSVSDNGTGFEPRFAERIFAPFERLHGPQVPGSGIGLAICRRIIERMGGRIWAESAAGRGATFFFVLPDCDSGI
jgi:light-regulated signal transduction histidine kinase (bacteriophytochrome)